MNLKDAKCFPMNSERTHSTILEKISLPIQMIS